MEAEGSYSYKKIKKKTHISIGLINQYLLQNNNQKEQMNIQLINDQYDNFQNKMYSKPMK